MSQLLQIEVGEEYSDSCYILAKSLTYLYEKFPQLAYNVLEIEKILSRSHSFFKLVQNSANEFSEEGRGDDYINSIKICPLVRQEGVIELLKLANTEPTLSFPLDYIIGDFLAGDGYIEQTANTLIRKSKGLTFVNSDISYYMFQVCKNAGRFTVLQNANDLYWLRSNSLDAGIFAYGTHHIPQIERSQAAKEAARVLKIGGRWVLHDFEEGGSMARWFRDIVNTFGKTRHDYPHFTSEEMLGLAMDAGLRDIKLDYISDSFVVQATTEAEALSLLAEYVINMYGLTGLSKEISKTIELLEQYFGVDVHHLKTGNYEARITRNALVCHGTK
jgi:ubiquinone/menaquinone biosynthesis C-methylase UbiE